MNKKYMLAIAAFAFITVLSVCALSVSDDSSADDSKAAKWGIIGGYELPEIPESVDIKFTDNTDPRLIDVTVTFGAKSETFTIPRLISVSPMDVLKYIEGKIIETYNYLVQNNPEKIEEITDYVQEIYEDLKDEYPKEIEEITDRATEIYNEIADEVNDYEDIIDYAADLNEDVKEFLTEPVTVEITNKKLNKLGVEITYGDDSFDFKIPRTISISDDMVRAIAEFVQEKCKDIIGEVIDLNALSKSSGAARMIDDATMDNFWDSKRVTIDDSDWD